MSTQQDIYAAGSESLPPMLNKENYVPWSSRLLCYTKSRPNGKLIHNSIINGPYVRRMIPEPAPRQDQPSFNQSYMQQPMPNPKDITDPTTAMNMALALMAKAFKLNYSTPTNNNQRISLNPCNRQIVQPGNASKNMNRNGNLMAARAEGNAAGQNENHIRCYNCRGVSHFARNCTVRAMRRDAAYLQTQLLIAQKEEVGIQLQPEQYDLMVVAADLDEIEEVNTNCILMANLQQASTSGTQSDKAPVYDSDGSAEVKSTIVTLQRVFKHRMTLETHNWSSSAHQELYKIVKDENFPIVNQVDARVQNFEIQFLKEAAKFVGDFKSLAKEADESLAKYKALELELERLLRTVVSQDIMTVVQNASVVDTSDLQTERERTKERFENCIIKKENEYAKLWNDWYKKCDECKYDKISYDKAYKDMQQKIEWLQAQLEDLKGKSKDTSCVSDTQNPLSQKLESKNVELEFQVFDQKDNTHDTSANTKFTKQSIMENLPMIGESHALSKLVTSNSVSPPQESKGVNNDKVIAQGMFKINHLKTYREEKHMPNNVSASARIKPITISQPSVISKKKVNSDSNGFSSIGIDNIKSRRPQPRSNTKNDRVPLAFKSSRSKNKEAEVEEHHRNLLLSKNNKHMSSACNNIKLDYQNVISKVVCAMCKKCLIFVNHDVCLRNYVNGKNSPGRKHKANVSIKEKQKKHQLHVKKPKKVGFLKRLATPKLKKLDFSLGTVRFRNDHVVAILGFGDLYWGNILISRVYFVEGLGHNLFSVGQLCDSDLEVAFRRNACFARNLEGVDSLKGDRLTTLYTINLHEMASTSPICLMARAFSTKSWLWH
nr:integrase, catalytic region, zinc finger, CCHC-type, peptidase aspartic, catalytic [Tanacetum cinerariifolium]